MRGTYLSFALGTFQEGESNPGTVPLLSQDLVEALHVEHVLAADCDRRFFSKTGGVAYFAVIIRSAAIENLIFLSCCFIILLDTIFLETGQAGLFSLEATASVSTLVYFVTRPIHQLDALGLTTHFLEGCHHVEAGTLDKISAETALSGLLFRSSCLAGHSRVVRRFCAEDAVVFLAVVAPESMLCEVLCSFF